MHELKELYSGKTNEELCEILHSPDYVASARLVARQILEERGLRGAALDDWRDPHAGEAIPSWTSDLTPSQVQTARRYRKVFYRLTLPSFIVAEIAASLQPTLVESLFLTVSAFLIVHGALRRYRWTFYYSIPFSFAAAIAIAWFASQIILLDGLLPSVILVLVIHNAFWEAPARVFILRPFDHKTNARQIRRFVKKNLRFYGHIYTLADKRLSGGASVLPWRDTYLWSVLGLIGSFGAKVGVSSDLPKLRRIIARQWARNLNWLISVDKIFKVRVANSWWQRAFQYIANSSDLVIIDLSNVGQGLLWEIDELGHYQIGEKTLLIVARSKADQVRAWLMDRWPDHPPLFLYNLYGDLDTPTVFHDCIANIIGRRAELQQLDASGVERENT